MVVSLAKDHFWRYVLGGPADGVCHELLYLCVLNAELTLLGVVELRLEKVVCLGSLRSPLHPALLLFYFAQAEIYYFYMASAINEDVFWLQISVNNTILMHEFES